MCLQQTSTFFKWRRQFALLVAVEVHASGDIHALGAVLLVFQLALNARCYSMRASISSSCLNPQVAAAGGLVFEVAAFSHQEVDARLVELDTGVR